MPPDPDRPRIGVFGGTFDPPHLGHLVAAQEARETLLLDRLVFVPARRSPHRMDESTSPASTRVEMVRAAIQGADGLALDDLELDREGPSYTVDTLEAFADRRPEAELFLIMGADQWTRFDTWHRPHQIAKLARLAILTREGDRPGETEPTFDDGPPPSFVAVPTTRLDISATLVRQRIRSGRSVRFLVPEGVRRIIEVENLYLRRTSNESE